DRIVSRRAHRARPAEARAIAVAARRDRAPELALPQVAALRDPGCARQREPRLAGTGARPGPAHRAGRRAADHVRGVGKGRGVGLRGLVDPPRTLTWEC